MAITCPMSGEIIRRSVLSDQSGKESFLLTEFEEVGIIGRGAFGIVKLCRNRLDDGFYAVKIVSASSKTLKYSSIGREVKALARLQHPHIVRYHQAWLEENFAGASGCSTDERLTFDSIDVNSPCMYIQMEYCPRSLKNFLETSHNLNEEMAWKLFRQIMEGLAKVHMSGVSHHDLSSANILLDEEDNIRISDFGLAELYGHGKKVDTTADILSLAFIFTEIYKYLPTHEKSRLFQNLREKKDFPESWTYAEHEKLLKKVKSILAHVRSSPTDYFQLSYSNTIPHVNSRGDNSWS